MQFDWWTFALQTANFAILVWLLQRFLYRPALRLMDTRKSEVQKQYADAAAVEAKAKAVLADIEAQRAAMLAERSAALKAVATQAEQVATAVRVQAEHAATALLDAARKTLAAERDAALVEARHTALDLGTDIARRLLALMPEELRAQSWLERIEQHLAAMSVSERAALIRELHGGEALRVVTAIPLSERLVTEWRTRLARVLGEQARIEFEVDAALVAGAELHCQSLMLRFSWSSSLATLRTELETS